MLPDDCAWVYYKMNKLLLMLIEIDVSFLILSTAKVLHFYS